MSLPISSVFFRFLPFSSVALFGCFFRVPILFLFLPFSFLRFLPFHFQKKSGTNFRAGDFAPPEPEFRAEFWETNFGRPNFGLEFRGRIFWLCFFQQKRPPEKFTLEKFTSKNSPSKIQPRNRAQKFTLRLCRAANSGGRG